MLCREVRKYSGTDGHFSEGRRSEDEKVPHGQKWKISGKKTIKYYQIGTTI